MEITVEELDRICWLTVELTKIRQQGCNHLSVEDFSPDLFTKLLQYYKNHKEGLVTLD